MRLRGNRMDWALVGAFALLLLVCSMTAARPVRELPQLLPGRDKALHFCAYGILCVFLCRALGGPPAMGLGRMAAALLLAIFYGLMIEALQAGLAARTCSLWDAGANAAGALAGAVVWLAAMRRKRAFTLMRWWRKPASGTGEPMLLDGALEGEEEPRKTPV